MSVTRRADKIRSVVRPENDETREKVRSEIYLSLSKIRGLILFIDENSRKCYYIFDELIVSFFKYRRQYIREGLYTK